MEHGHTVDGGDRLAKTIIFARNHAHATFIEERFNHHYPRYAGHFARIIDHHARVRRACSTILTVGQAPHIAISVDMLDTGVDVPEVANLVFFSQSLADQVLADDRARHAPVPDLFGPGGDKHDFRVFDFCFNFDFSRATGGIEAGGGVPSAPGSPGRGCSC